MFLGRLIQICPVGRIQIGPWRAFATCPFGCSADTTSSKCQIVCSHHNQVHFVTWKNHLFSSHFDAKTMAFLGRIGSLLTVLVMHNVSEDFLDNLRTALTTMAPLLDSIHALSCNEHTLPVAQQCLGEKFNMAKKLLYVPTRDEEEAVVQANVNTIMDWLTQPAVEGPRLLYGFKDSPFSVQIIQAVRQVCVCAI